VTEDEFLAIVRDPKTTRREQAAATGMTEHSLEVRVSKMRRAGVDIPKRKNGTTLTPEEEATRVLIAGRRDLSHPVKARLAGVTVKRWLEWDREARGRGLMPPREVISERRHAAKPVVRPMARVKAPPTPPPPKERWVPNRILAASVMLLKNARRQLTLSELVELLRATNVGVTHGKLGMLLDDEAARGGVVALGTKVDAYCLPESEPGPA
jgi:hypothetical protein